MLEYEKKSMVLDDCSDDDYATWASAVYKTSIAGFNNFQWYKGKGELRSLFKTKGIANAIPFLEFST